jgi:hypothetical protein
VKLDLRSHRAWVHEPQPLHQDLLVLDRRLGVTAPVVALRPPWSVVDTTSRCQKGYFPDFPRKESMSHLGQDAGRVVELALDGYVLARDPVDRDQVDPVVPTAARCGQSIHNHASANRSDHRRSVLKNWSMSRSNLSPLSRPKSPSPAGNARVLRRPAGCHLWIISKGRLNEPSVLAPADLQIAAHGSTRPCAMTEWRGQVAGVALDRQVNRRVSGGGRSVGRRLRAGNAGQVSADGTGRSDAPRSKARQPLALARVLGLGFPHIVFLTTVKRTEYASPSPHGEDRGRLATG